MAALESALSALEEKLAEVQKATDALTKGVKGLRQAAKLGQIGDIEKRLSTVAERAREAEAVSRSLAGAWSFDTPEYLGGGYFDELSAAAAEAGIKLFEKDGRVYAFPLLLRIEPRETAVRISRKLERRIRPKELVKLLAAMQKRPQRFREQQFLDLLHRAYQSVAGLDWRKVEAGRGPPARLSDLHALLTLLPGSDYPIEEFGRDLLLLDRQPDLTTREGHGFQFAGSTGSKDPRAKRVRVYDEEGREREYLDIVFVKRP
jgi:hypothetical protein